MLANRPNTALLVVDMQNGVVEGAHGRGAVVENVGALVEHARRERVPVVWVQHSDERLARGSDEWRIVPELTPDGADPLVEKSYSDAFEDSMLEAVLSSLGVGRLVVAGAQTDECIRGTLHGALVRGYDATLVSDAHTTEDLTAWGAPPPDQVIAHTNLYWSNQTAPRRTAGTVETADVDFGSSAPWETQSALQTVTVAERPDLLERAWEETAGTIPEYNHHGDVLNAYWDRLTEERPEFQFYLLDGDEILARGHSLPVRWDGSIGDLPAGIDGAIARGFDEGGANVLCAMLVAIPRNHQGRALSPVAVAAMREVARRHGLTALIAPVRPNWKERYPLVPIEQYATWTRPDGLLFDPWMRVHERAGATVLKPEPRSLRITGTVAEWEEWTQMAFPHSGDYWFPGGLATVRIDRDADSGSYWEPNVWMHHTV